MKRYERRPGVVLVEVCGEPLLVATGDAREKCPYVTRLNSAAAAYWRCLKQPYTLSELVKAAAEELGQDGKTVLIPAMTFLGKMSKAGYIITMEEP